MVELTRWYRRVRHTPPMFGPPRIARRSIFLWSPSTVALKPLIPNDVLIRSFMSKTIAGLPSDPTKWKGIRFLGDGASAMAGLWVWEGSSDIAAPPFTQVVVKEALRASRSLRYERDFLISCNRSSSTHLLKTLQDSDVNRGMHEGLGPEWNEAHLRLFLEYCYLESMEDLLHKRIIKESEVAGRYSFVTNVWGVGVIMYQLVTLSEDLPNLLELFLPNWNVALSQSPTYGLDIRAYNYGQSLTDLIFECLSEKPGCRPDLFGLKNRVIDGYSAAHAADTSFEPYSDFQQPEPVHVDYSEPEDLLDGLSHVSHLHLSPWNI
ncbi:hypothetical protein BKA64DRAFT_645575 [Cadophora sp. MPI-SDFR-AT-0126]|nr:hypothetical protein BKA64DRAFT_645575 [Leotiomycetes sp. MPI-SDFR-AT-0126]